MGAFVTSIHARLSVQDNRITVMFCDGLRISSSSGAITGLACLLVFIAIHFQLLNLILSAVRLRFMKVLSAHVHQTVN